MNNKEYLLNGLNKTGINATDAQLEMMLKFMDIVVRENEKINLTAITEPEEFIEKHLIDCALGIKYLKNNTKIIDIGSGAGFPGIVLKILRDDLEILLVDSLNKRVKYLNNTIEELGLSKIKAIHARAEELGHDPEYREAFNHATARAVANLNMLMEYTMPFIKPGGSFIALKGSKGTEELKDSQGAIGQLSGKLNRIDELKLPYSDSEREIIVVDKVKPIQKFFPRKQAKIKKKPL